MSNTMNALYEDQLVEILYYTTDVNDEGVHMYAKIYYPEQSFEDAFFVKADLLAFE